MAFRLLRATDRIAAPWKNGGGVTREVAAWPPGSGLEDFDWRVSQAEVAAEGPFSRFDGVDRVLTMLDGTMTLAIGGRPPVVLTAGSEPFAFPGEAAVLGTPVGGPVSDLNVMARRGRYAASVTRVQGGRHPASDVDIVFALETVEVLTLSEAFHLQRHDALVREADTASEVTVQGRVLLIALRRG